MNCSQPKEGNAVGSCEQIAEPNDENRPRLARTMDRTTPAMLSTSQDKATVRIGLEEHKVPVTSIMPEEDHRYSKIPRNWVLDCLCKTKQMCYLKIVKNIDGKILFLMLFS